MDIALLISRYFRILIAPVLYPEMIWVAFPLLVSMVLIEVYFGRYAKEQLGWNSAVSNSLVLVFVGIDLLRKVVDIKNIRLILGMDLLVSLAILISGLVMLYLTFYHKLPQALAFLVCSVLSVNMIAYLAVVFVYSDIPLDLASLVSSVLLVASVWLLFQLVHLFERKSYV